MEIKTIKEFTEKFCTSPSIKYVFGINGTWAYHLDDDFIRRYGDRELVDVKCDWSNVYADEQNRQMRFNLITKEGKLQ